MAQKILTVYEDDLSGEEIADGKGGPVQFGFEGASYVIDLTDKNRKEFEKVLTPYLNAAKPDRTGRRTTKKAASAGDAAKIRDWAQDEGIQVSERGRVSAEVREAYKAAH